MVRTAITLLGLALLALTVNISSAWVTALITLSYLLFLYAVETAELSLHAGRRRAGCVAAGDWLGRRGGELEVDAWVLFAIMFLWQVPHTLAIARLYRDDFAKAGIHFCR